MRPTGLKGRSAVGLALLALACGGAGAQQAVPYYGIVDVGVQRNRQYAAASQQQESVFGVDSGYQSGSRFGLRGAERLGGGLGVVFMLEGGFDGSTGGSLQGGRLFGRQAWAGLQGPSGSLVAGRLAMPSSGTGAFDFLAAVDPFGVGFGINTLGSTFIAANALRQDNAVLFVTPMVDGVRGAAGYSVNRSDAETAPQGTDSKAINLSASYTSGSLYAVATYDVLAYPGTGSAAAGAGNPDQKLLQLGFAYDLRIVKLFGAWASQEAISAVRAGVSVAPPGEIVAYDNRAWMAGLSLPLGRGALMASYQYADAESQRYSTAAGSADFEPDYTVWGVAFSYPLSTRTNVYLGYGQVSARGTLSPILIDRQQSAFGLRHRF